jgi:hypothetical protein
MNMELTGLHFLLTYQCTLECDHCFAWGSPWQNGTMTAAFMEEVFNQAKDTRTIEWIYFEGGEPFLYYPLLLNSVQKAARMGFKVGIVSNSFWAQTVDDALLWLEPFQGLIQDLTISSDLYHWNENLSQQAKNSSAAAKQLNIPEGIISIAQPENLAEASFGQLPLEGSSVMYRGRASEKLINKVELKPSTQFIQCPHEDLREPGRLHLDYLGNLHICQGIVIGNLLNKQLKDICADYAPDVHPITGPLIRGGPLELRRVYNLPTDAQYADACHMCYISRLELRNRFPEYLQPDQMYGKY